MRLTGKFDSTGKLTFFQSTAYIAGLATRKGLIGKDVLITLERPRRTLRHNRYYFSALVEPIADALTEFHGEIVTIELAHELLKAKFGKDEIIVDPETGEEILKGKTTKTMNKDEFGAYVAECERFGSQFLGIDWAELDIRRMTREFETLID